MQTNYLVGKTGPDGTLNLRLPFGQANTEVEVVVVVHPKEAGEPVPPATGAMTPWAVLIARPHSLTPPPEKS